MDKILHRKSLVFGLPLLLLLFLVFLQRSSIFAAHSADLARGITLDFIITTPLLYFMLVRKRKDIPKLTVLSVFIGCLIIASFVLAVEHQSLLKSVKAIAIPLVELTVVVYLVIKVRTMLKAYVDNEAEKLDFFDTLKAACTSTFPGRIGDLFATEIAVVYYFFKAKKKREVKDNEFTYYKKSGIVTVAGAFIGLAVVETLIVHFLIQLWSDKVAWVLTFISFYTCMQIIALLRSMPQRLIEIDRDRKIIHLRYGFFSQTSIPIGEVSKLFKHRKTLPTNKSVVSFSPLEDLDGHNVIIETTSENVAHRLYGIKKKYSALAFT